VITVKKGLALLFLFVGLILIISIKNDDSAYVYQEYDVYNQELDNYSIYNINFENIYVTTKNIYNYIDSNMKILGFYPLLNNIYNNYFKTEWYYCNHETISKNIEIFTKYISNSLKEKGFINEVSNININGIRLKKIMVEASTTSINNLQKKYSGIIIN
jgi:hypothetical protein